MTYKQIIFCSRPGACPVQDKCRRNLSNWDVEPPVRVYQIFVWTPSAACSGFIPEVNNTKT